MKKIILVSFLFANIVNAQTTYVITNPAGYSQGTVQIQGNQGQIVNNAGRVTQSVTVYPNQVVTPSGYAVGTPSYTVPPSPLSPPSPRVLQ
jgi:hypothetical protein